MPPTLLRRFEWNVIEMTRVRMTMSDETVSPIVLDASAAIALIRSEGAERAITDQLSRLRVSGGRLLVPDHFWIELTNVFMNRYAASPGEAVQILREVDELGVESMRTERALVLHAIEFMHRHRLSAYDATYLALAESEDARLLTLDVKLAAAAGDRAIRLDGIPPRRLSEGATEYGRDPVDWARFGPYLAQLRAEAIAGAR